MTVLESVLLEEYERINNTLNILNKDLINLPKGSIQPKVINNNTYQYLVYRDNDKVKSTYIKKNNLDVIKQQLNSRKEIISSIKDLKKSKKQIERALGKKFINEWTTKGIS